VPLGQRMSNYLQLQYYSRERAFDHALVHLNKTQVVLEDGAPCHVLGLAAVAPAVLVHMLVIFSIACMAELAVRSSTLPGLDTVIKSDAAHHFPLVLYHHSQAAALQITVQQDACCSTGASAAQRQIAPWCAGGSSDSSSVRRSSPGRRAMTCTPSGLQWGGLSNTLSSRPPACQLLYLAT
jgi:hypothetical protein